MSNVWFLLIWLSAITVEAFIYSLMNYYMSGPYCNPTRISNAMDSFFEFFDRFCGYQSWFIPMIWLMWPTKANKAQNRSRHRAAKSIRQNHDSNQSSTI